MGRQFVHDWTTAGHHINTQQRTERLLHRGVFGVLALVNCRQHQPLAPTSLQSLFRCHVRRSDAPVHQKIRAGDKRGRVAGQKEYAAGDLFRLAKAPHGNMH